MTEIGRLQARIKELESEKHINSVKAQAIEEFIEISLKNGVLDNKEAIDVIEMLNDYAEKLNQS